MHGPQMDPERIPNGFRTDPTRTLNLRSLNGFRTDAERTPNEDFPSALRLTREYFSHCQVFLTNRFSDKIRKGEEQIRDFHRNSRFSPKFQIFAKFSDFRQIFRFSPKFQIFPQNIQIFFPAAAEPQDLCRRRGGGSRGRSPGNQKSILSEIYLEPLSGSTLIFGADLGRIRDL